MVNLQQVITLMSEIAPQSEAMDWDNVGIQVGDYNNNIEKVLIALDINEKVVDEAIEKNIDLIVSHHPLIFNGIKNIHSQTAKGNIIIKAIKKDIAIYSAHTNMDIAESGLNDYLADMLDIVDTEVLSTENEHKRYKLAVYVPIEDAENLREVLFKKGAGKIGNYSNTSFNVNGQGTFKPGDNTNPHIGVKGQIEKVQETKIETIVKGSDLQKVIKAMLKEHPYEEVAYDVYELPFQSKYSGIGRIGYIDKEMTLKEYSKKIKEVLNIEKLKVRGNIKQKIKKVAICSGSGADFINTASSKGADLYITGDVKYHEAQLAEELGLNLIDAGHFETENIFKELVYNYLDSIKEKKKLDFEIFKSEVSTNPWKYY
ncbi:MAG: Nif3-like dinuclear metal center hexameric protein [Bacillota bacterium]